MKMNWIFERVPKIIDDFWNFDNILNTWFGNLIIEV